MKTVCFRINLVVEPASVNNTLNDDEKVVYLGDDTPVVVKPSQRKKSNSESKGKTVRTEETNEGK